MERVSLKHLAAKLGVSISTVSRALRDRHDVSESTRKDIQALAEDMGFRPNPYAGSLRNNKSKTVAVVIPEIENNFFSQFVNGVQVVANRKGYHVLIYLTHEDFVLEKDVLGRLSNGRVDGLMISVAGTTTAFTHLEACRRAGLPIVLFDRIANGIDAPSVTTDDAVVSLEATGHLLQNGCRKIAFLSPSPSLSIARRRLEGYYNALQKHGADSWQQVVYCGADDEKNRRRITDLLKQADRPDGIFAAAEKFAVNIYQVCDQLGIRIPHDLKVVSFSNLPASALFDPPLSSIVQPAHDMGKESASILFKTIENKSLLSCEERPVLPSRLIIRESGSAVARTQDQAIG